MNIKKRTLPVGISFLLMVAMVSSFAYTPTHYSEEHAEPLTPQLQANVSLEDSILALSSQKLDDIKPGIPRYYSKTQYPEGYAGKYRNEDGSTTLLYTDTNKNTPYSNAIDPSGVKIEYSATYSLNELNETLDIIIAHMDEHPDILGSGISMTKNRVCVDYYMLDEQKEADFKEKVIDSPMIELNRATAKHEFTQPRAGDTIRKYTSSTTFSYSTLCIGVKNASNVSGFLTHAHGSVTQGMEIKDDNRNLIGIVGTLYPWADTAFVESRNYTVQNILPNGYSIIDAGTIEERDPVTMYGHSSGSSSGTVTEVNYSTTLDGNTVYNLFKASYTSQNGDSGGPVVYDNAHIAGLHSGHATNGSYSFAVQGSYILSASGTTLR